MPQSRAHASQHPRRCKETGAIITGLTPRQFAKAKPPGTLRTNSERRNQESRKYQPCGEERGHLTSPQGLPRLRAHGVQPREQRLRHLSARLRARESGGRASLEQGRKESTARGQSRPPVVPTSLLPRPARSRDHKRGFSSRRSLAVTPARCVGYPRQELPVSPYEPCAAWHTGAMARSRPSSVASTPPAAPCVHTGGMFLEARGEVWAQDQGIQGYQAGVERGEPWPCSLQQVPSDNLGEVKPSCLGASCSSPTGCQALQGQQPRSPPDQHVLTKLVWVWRSFY